MGKLTVGTCIGQSSTHLVSFKNCTRLVFIQKYTCLVSLKHIFPFLINSFALIKLRCNLLTLEILCAVCFTSYSYFPPNYLWFLKLVRSRFLQPWCYLVNQTSSWFALLFGSKIMCTKQQLFHVEVKKRVLVGWTREESLANLICLTGINGLMRYSDWSKGSWGRGRTKPVSLRHKQTVGGPPSPASHSGSCCLRGS